LLGATQETTQRTIIAVQWKKSKQCKKSKQRVKRRVFVVKKETGEGRKTISVEMKRKEETRKTLVGEEIVSMKMNLNKGMKTNIRGGEDVLEEGQ